MALGVLLGKERAVESGCMKLFDDKFVFTDFVVKCFRRRFGPVPEGQTCGTRPSP